MGFLFRLPMGCFYVELARVVHSAANSVLGETGIWRKEESRGKQQHMGPRMIPYIDSGNVVSQGYFLPNHTTASHHAVCHASLRS